MGHNSVIESWHCVSWTSLMFPTLHYVWGGGRCANLLERTSTAGNMASIKRCKLSARRYVYAKIDSSFSSSACNGTHATPLQNRFTAGKTFCRHLESIALGCLLQTWTLSWTSNWLSFRCLFVNMGIDGFYFHWIYRFLFFCFFEYHSCCYEMLIYLSVIFWIICLYIC